MDLSYYISFFRKGKPREIREDCYEKRNGTKEISLRYCKTIFCVCISQGKHQKGSVS